jgi:hypothetical protein
MKKIISIIILTLLSVCVSNAQEIVRSLQAGEWKITLEEDVTYTLETNSNIIVIKEGEILLHSLIMPDSLIFNSFPTIDEGVIINGVKWATRNLATHGKFVENPKDYGALFQWGRVGDGHEQRYSLTYDGAVNGSQNFDENGQIKNTHPAYGKFIAPNGGSYDWRVPQNNTLWNSGSESVPIKTANDPCPDGWRLPTKTELATLGDGEWTDTPVLGRSFGSGSNLLFLPVAGSRHFQGSGYGDGKFGYYWSCTPISTSTYFLGFSSDELEIFNSGTRAYGFSIRCVAE